MDISAALGNRPGWWVHQSGTASGACAPIEVAVRFLSVRTTKLHSTPAMITRGSEKITRSVCVEGRGSTGHITSTSNS